MNYDFTGIPAWQSIEGFFSLSEAVAIQSAAKQLPPGSVLVELGSFRGKSSVAIASILPQESILHCVDSFEHTILDPGEEKPPIEVVKERNITAFMKTVEDFGVKEKIQLHVMKTLDAAEKFEPESVDLILVDADHHYDAVKADIETWYPKLKPGGYLFCDDYEEKWPSVVRAIHATGLKGGIIAPSLWVHRKPLPETIE